MAKNDWREPDEQFDVKEGQFFFTSRGQYSDYSWGSMMRAKKDFNFRKVYTDSIIEGGLNEDKKFQEQDVDSYLVKNGYAEEVESREFYIDYGYRETFCTATANLEDIKAAKELLMEQKSVKQKPKK